MGLGIEGPKSMLIRVFKIVLIQHSGGHPSWYHVGTPKNCWYKWESFIVSINLNSPLFPSSDLALSEVPINFIIVKISNYMYQAVSVLCSHAFSYYRPSFNAGSFSLSLDYGMYASTY